MLCTGHLSSSASTDEPTCSLPKLGGAQLRVLPAAFSRMCAVLRRRQELAVPGEGLGGRQR